VPCSVVTPYNNTYVIYHEIAARHFGKNELIHEIVTKSKLSRAGGSHRSRQFTSMGHFVETD